MSVYKHEQGTYRSYRVARSVNGKLRQAYFPRTRKGYRSAKELDEEWQLDQESAQESFTGPALRWRNDKSKRTPARAQKRKTVRQPRRKSA